MLKGLLCLIKLFYLQLSCLSEQRVDLEGDWIHDWLKTLTEQCKEVWSRIYAL
jgi:hypothetical protein